jgi:NADPH-dependent 2,4-dienoyl-CoA reductase/sulfur reductase-like enzyme
VTLDGAGSLRADTLVVGGGPAGIAAAAAAAESGDKVILLDEGMGVGGQIWRHRAGKPVPRDASTWLGRLNRSSAKVICGAAVISVRPHDDDAGFIAEAECAHAPLTAHCDRLIIATGARERFLPFPGWTLPGVFGIGGMQALLKMGATFRGKRVVIAGTGPLLLPVAAALARDGAELMLVAEQAPRGRVFGYATSLWRKPALLIDAARYRVRFLGTRYALGTWITEAAGSSGVRGVTVTDGRSSRAIECDVLCTGYGLVPSTELPRSMGCEITRGAVVVDERQETSVAGVFCAGEPTGVGGSELAVVEGEIAGLSAAGHDREAERFFPCRKALRSTAAALDRAFAPRNELRALPGPETVVCRCEDVRLATLRPEWVSRQAKLYTRAGMGPCQGRVCGTALEFLFGWAPDVVRPPLEPSLISTLLAEPAEPGMPLGSGAS